MLEHDREFYLKQLVEIHQYVRQHINLVAGGFLTFAALNASFASLSRSLTQDGNSRLPISRIINLGFAFGDCVAAAVFLGASLQLIRFWLKAETILKMSKVELLDGPPSRGWINILADPLLRVCAIDKARLGCPANPIPLREVVSTFMAFSVICTVAACVWFSQFLLQYSIP